MMKALVAKMMAQGTDILNATQELKERESWGKVFLKYRHADYDEDLRI